MEQSLQHTACSGRTVQFVVNLRVLLRDGLRTEALAVDAATGNEFVPIRRVVEDAVRDLCRAFKQGQLPDSMTDERYVNVKVLKQRRAV